MGNWAAPVIAKSAIAAFLAKPRRDSRLAKRFDDEALDYKLSQLEPPPVFKTAPRTSQKVGFLLTAAYPNYLLFFDMGLGKSWIAANAFAWRKARGEATRALVLAPYSSVVIGWKDQIKEHTDLTYAGVYGSKEDKAEAKEFTEDVVGMTYAMLLIMCSEVETEKKMKADGTVSVKRKRRFSPRKAKLFLKSFDFIIIDESTMIRNTQSETYRTVKWLCWRTPFRYALAGRPFGKDPEDLWGQFNAVDEGESLGDTLGIFRGTFFTGKRGFFGGIEWKFDKSRQEDLNRCMRHKSILYEAAECQDLPAVNRVVTKVYFSDEQRQYHARLIEDLRRADGNFTLIDNIFLRMRQLTAGFLGVKDPEGERVIVTFKENPKLDALMERVEQVPNDCKLIIFNEYVASGDLIAARLKKDKIRHVRLYGATTNKAAVLDRFKSDPKIRAMLINVTSGSMGLNLQHANYCFYFESPTCPIIRAQADKRLHRMGQLKKVFINDLVVAKTVDTKILKSIREGNNLYAGVTRDPKSLLEMLQ